MERVAGRYRASLEDGTKREGRAVILASGVALIEIDLPHSIHEAAIEAGVLRYCPVCDGYEHRKRIGVVGCDSDGAAEALFLRQYSEDITLMPLNNPELSCAQARQMAEVGVVVETGPLLSLEPHPDHIDVHLKDREPLTFDVIYPALGCRPRAELADAWVSA